MRLYGILKRHLGPGTHPGGTPQSVHGKKGGQVAGGPAVDKKAGKDVGAFAFVVDAISGVDDSVPTPPKSYFENLAADKILAPFDDLNDAVGRLHGVFKTEEDDTSTIEQISDRNCSYLHDYKMSVTVGDVAKSVGAKFGDKVRKEFETALLSGMEVGWKAGRKYRIPNKGG